MNTFCRGSVVLASLPFIVFSHVDASQEPEVLCLLQTGANLQRSSVPSDFFEIEELGSSTNSAAARFDVGNNVVPVPRLKQRLSLAEIDPPARELAPEQQAVKDQAPQPDVLAAMQAQAMEVVSVEPPAPVVEAPVQAAEAVEPPAPAAEAVTADSPKPPQAAKVNSAGLYDAETPETASKFLEEQSDAGGEDSLDADDDDDASAVAAVETKSKPQHPLAVLLQAKIKATAARQAIAAHPARKAETHQKLFKDFLRDATAQTLRDSDASRVAYGSAMHMMPREPEMLLDLPESSKDSTLEASTTDLRATMARVNEDERRLVDALSARQHRANAFPQ